MFLLQRGDALHLDRRAELDLVPGHRRSPAEPGDLRVHLELLEHLGQRGDHDVVGVRPLLGRRARPQQGGGRKGVAAERGAGQHQLLGAPRRARPGGPGLPGYGLSRVGRAGPGHLAGSRGLMGVTGSRRPEAERFDQAFHAVRARPGGRRARRYPGRLSPVGPAALARPE